nr:MAG TPA: hypothetical protein [Caudoviricetes sp.]
MRGVTILCNTINVLFAITHSTTVSACITETLIRYRAY